MAVHAIAPGCATGLELEMGERVIKRRAKLDSMPLHIRVERAGGWVERSGAFVGAVPTFQPAEPPEVPAVGRTIEVAKATVLVILEVKLRGQRELAKIRAASSAIGRILRLRQRGQQQCSQQRDNGDDNEKFDEGEGGRGARVEGREPMDSTFDFRLSTH